MPRPFQQYTNDELTNILENKIMVIFNYNQQDAGIDTVNRNEVFDVSINLSNEDLKSVKAGLRISTDYKSRFSLFVINTYEVAGKVYYKKYSNGIDCDVILVFNEWEEKFIIAKDFS